MSTGELKELLERVKGFKVKLMRQDDANEVHKRGN